jgi:hypothetical protein
LGLRGATGGAVRERCLVEEGLAADSAKRSLFDQLEISARLYITVKSFQ